MSVSSAREAVTAPRQHVKACHDCPWRRIAPCGWLGALAPAEWVEAAHTETLIDCHTVTNQQCAGVAIYRANVAKKPRHAHILVLPADRDTVFAAPQEFLDHHNRRMKMATGKPRGFAAMSPEKQREIASMGGKAAHKSGNAHEFTPDEAREAGRKGGGSRKRLPKDVGQLPMP
jgi:general stress protein YciG